MRTNSKRRETKYFLAKDLIRFFGPNYEISLMAENLDTCRYTLYKWIQNDVQISEWAADKYAIKLGLHPSEIWTDWFDV